MKINFAEGLAKAIYESLAADPNVMLIGSGFMGLNSRGPRDARPGAARIFPSGSSSRPISELALAGAGIGAAMCGQRPVVDLSTGSFIFEAFPQVVNEAANIHYMTGGQTSVPVTFYSLAGSAARGAAQHSHRTQAMLGPGARPADPRSRRGRRRLSPAALVAAGKPQPDGLPQSRPAVRGDRGARRPMSPMLPVGRARVRRQGRDLSIIASSIMVPRALAAAAALERDHGASAEVVDLRSIVPLDRAGVLQSVARTGRAVIADECHGSFGVAAEIAAVLAEDGLGEPQGAGAPRARCRTCRSRSVRRSSRS